jgi:hypothetical protein
MANSRYPDGPPAMFYCGDDAGAKKAAAQLASDLGFEPIDAGGITSARLLEPLAMLWIRLALAQGLGALILLFVSFTARQSCWPRARLLLPVSVAMRDAHGATPYWFGLRRTAE